MIYFKHSDFIEEISKFTCKILAVDLGTKKIGLATSHIALKVIIPLKVLLRKNNTYDINLLKTEVINNEIDAVIFGLPLDCNGKHTESTLQVLNFVNKFTKKVTLPITFFDERYTTKIANQRLIELGLSRNFRNQIDDQIAACIILEDFLKINFSL